MQKRRDKVGVRKKRKAIGSAGVREVLLEPGVLVESVRQMAESVMALVKTVKDSHVSQSLQKCQVLFMKF